MVFANIVLSIGWMYMGQYFYAVNETHKDYVSPWDIGGLAKFREWCANKWAGIFPYLLRKSSDGGGGSDCDTSITKYAGHWAGDKVYLVGDYDESNLFERAEKEYTNISKPLAGEYNDFIKLKELQLKVKK